MRIILQVEHAVSDFDDWKRLFDTDPLHREASGVRSYRVMRLSEDPNHVIAELEFDTAAEAEAFRKALIALWGRLEADLLRAPRARLIEVVETKDLRAAKAA
jgi:hypothetical protein